MTRFLWIPTRLSQDLNCFIYIIYIKLELFLMGKYWQNVKLGKHGWILKLGKKANWPMPKGRPWQFFTTGQSNEGLYWNSEPEHWSVKSEGPEQIAKLCRLVSISVVCIRLLVDFPVIRSIKSCTWILISIKILNADNGNYNWWGTSPSEFNFL